MHIPVTKNRGNLQEMQTGGNKRLHPFLMGCSRFCQHRLKPNLDNGYLRKWASRSGPLQGCPSCWDEQRISEFSVRNRWKTRGRRCMCLENGQNVPIAHPNSSEQAGTVFHGQWGGKHRLRSRFRKAFFGSFFGTKERTDEKGKANPQELRTERKSEYHISLRPPLLRMHRLQS